MKADFSGVVRVVKELALRSNAKARGFDPHTPHVLLLSFHKRQ